MPTITIVIQNCNNITDGELSIDANKLNIVFGRNGTGKSTIARAIYLESRSTELSELAPYGSESKTAPPSITGVPSGNIAIFDDNYVSQYVYQADSLIKDAFEVLIRSKEYDDAKKNIDDALEKIKTTITERGEIFELRQQIGTLISKGAPLKCC